MKNLLMIGLLVSTTFLLNACGGGSSTTTTANNSAAATTKTETPKAENAKVDDSKWTAKDKENAVNNCKFGRKNDDPTKVEKLCGCYLNKVITLSPNPAEQSKIPMSEVMKLNADCAKEAGL
ncbi:MAG TPA: hypothetical protein PKY59_17625 [Pyrinomonadaceae bacterium]|nr:hypothetical protein [Pyrinomonadaceae bacterium]